MPFTEAQYESAIIELFRDELGYAHRYGPELTRDHRSPLYEEQLLEGLSRVNSKLPEAAIREAVLKLHNFGGVNVIQNNRQFTDWLQNGVEVSFIQNGETKHEIVRLIDYELVNRNLFTVCNQWTVIGNETKRPDVVVFINGLPIAVIELKSCSREDTDVSEAYRQIRNYIQDIPALFYYNAFCVLSDLTDSRVGTITAGEDRYMEWKTVSGDYEETRYAAFDTLFRGMFDKERLLDILQNFILFAGQGGDSRKILAQYHQYFAVKKGVDSTAQAVRSDGRAGIFWHTTGSGKSLSMVFYAKQLQTRLHSPTLVVLTDRNDLDDQLYGTFSDCAEFLRQTPEQAEDRQDLRTKLSGREANGIIFTTMQKFEESDEPLSERKNIILIADEAHRSQYGLEEKVDAKTGKVKIGYARLVRDSLPNATFIGFTGTPVSREDRSTVEIFGNYIDVYDMTQAVQDGATKPVYYESRVINLGLNESILDEIDAAYEEMALAADNQHIEKSKKQLGKMEAILGADQTIKALCADIAAHYKDRANILTGKAMIVAYSRPIAMKIYYELMRLCPDWKEKVQVVMTATNSDPEEWKTVIGGKAYRKELERKFKDNGDPMKIAIVVDMWLTGFDVPSLATMYIYKPMESHNLIQAISRVNRVFKDKAGGLVVDYVGIARALKQAMLDFTRRDQEAYGDTDIKKTAYPKFLEKLEVCRSLFHGFDYGLFITGSDLDRARLIGDGINHILADEKRKELYVKEALLLSQAQTLCRSILNIEERMEYAFFEAVRTAITRVTQSRKLSLHEINSRVNELLKQSINAQEVINVFADESPEMSIFDPEFLDGIAEMKQKNLAAELLRKLLSEQITMYQKTNLVKSELFSERMKRLMNAYRNGQITNAEVIEELRRMADDITTDYKEADVLGLDAEEKAFYDALAKPENMKDFFENDALVSITKELAAELRASRTIDWQKKEQARAAMRSKVKRLLKRYKYPPEEVPYAVDAVIAQCEQWVDMGS